MEFLKRAGGRQEKHQGRPLNHAQSPKGRASLCREILGALPLCTGQDRLWGLAAESE